MSQDQGPQIIQTAVFWNGENQWLRASPILGSFRKPNGEILCDRGNSIFTAVFNSMSDRGLENFENGTPQSNSFNNNLGMGQYL